MSWDLEDHSELVYEAFLKSQKAGGYMTVSPSAYEDLRNLPAREYKKPSEPIALPYVNTEGKIDKFFAEKMYTKEELEFYKESFAVFAASVERRLRGEPAPENMDHRQQDIEKTITEKVRTREDLEAMKIVCAMYTAAAERHLRGEPAPKIMDPREQEERRVQEIERMIAEKAPTKEDLECLKQAVALFTAAAERHLGGEPAQKIVERLEQEEEKMDGNWEDREDQKEGREEKKKTHGKRAKSCQKLSQILATLETHKEDTDDRLDDLMRAFKISGDVRESRALKDFRIQQLMMELAAKDRECEEVKAENARLKATVDAQSKSIETLTAERSQNIADYKVPDDFPQFSRENFHLLAAKYFQLQETLQELLDTHRNFQECSNGLQKQLLETNERLCDVQLHNKELADEMANAVKEAKIDAEKLENLRRNLDAEIGRLQWDLSDATASLQMKIEETEVLVQEVRKQRKNYSDATTMMVNDLCEKQWLALDYEDLAKKYMRDMKEATGKDQKKPQAERSEMMAAQMRGRNVDLFKS